MKGLLQALTKHKKYTVAVVHNTVAPYRHVLFEELSRYLDLRVYYCSLKHSSRKWDVWPRTYDYEYKILSGLLLKTSVGELSVNLSVVKELFLNRPYALLLGGYENATMWLAFAVGMLLRIPVVVWTEGMREPQSILGAVTKPLRILFFKKSNAVVVPGRLSGNYVTSLGVDAEKVFIAPNATDNELFIKLSSKYQSGRRLKAQLELEGKVTILYVGQLIKRKGVSYLLRAFGKLEREHDDVMLVIVGSGPLEPHLKDLANSLKLKNFKIFHSGLSLEELVRLYSAADIFVLPTLEDIWGFVINEAMACGLPVVATHASQAAIEMIRSGENGYIVEEADSDELYLVLKNLVHNSGGRKKMGEKARETVEHEFDVSRMVKGFLSAIEYCTKHIRKRFQPACHL